jgi:two-component system, OmpR family, alkaline phosphatase synthesis response regulator PhoP
MPEISGHKILLVDDEPDILDFLSYNLKKEGYSVITASNGVEAIAKAKKELPHLIVLDIMMPEMDGIETCRQIREISALDNSVITFLTARNEEYTQVSGFDVGADDFITKPIKPRVFLSRVKALLRRYKSDKPVVQQVIDLGDLKIDMEKHMIYKGGTAIDLPKKEFNLLVLLSSKPGKVFKRESILDLVWGDDVVVGDRTIDVHIRKLREKLGEDYIKTVKGVGYKFEF